MSTVMLARADEHRYFLAAAVVLTLLVIWAFSFEYRDLVHPSPFSVLVQVHGLVMFAWVGLFLTQTALIALPRPLWHRRLGVIGMVQYLGLPHSFAGLGNMHCCPRHTPYAFPRSTAQARR